MNRSRLNERSCYTTSREKSHAEVGAQGKLKSEIANDAKLTLLGRPDLESETSPQVFRSPVSIILSVYNVNDRVRDGRRIFQQRDESEIDNYYYITANRATTKYSLSLEVHRTKTIIKAAVGEMQ